MMNLVVNGEQRDVTEGITAAQLLEYLKVQPEQVVVEVNLEIVKRAQLAAATLKEGDQVEIVRLVGGGT